jgi:hypothetical protein
LVRRVLWEHEIVGSSPATPTIRSSPSPVLVAVVIDDRAADI